MGKLFQKATSEAALFHAWQRIRANGSQSQAKETRIAIDVFAAEAPRHITRIQRLLRSGEFQFDPQKGVLKKKRSGGKRGIVMASVQNRIVERALLDTLQANSNIAKIANETPTSVGGVPHRSVPHGLAIIEDAFSKGRQHFVRSDITGFFEHVSRQRVIGNLASEIEDERFLKLLNQATMVTLGNEATLGEDRSVFPSAAEGVAQGSPLSPLFGNIILGDFDRQFNERGITCVRFIDDFVLLGARPYDVQKAFANAQKHLNELGLTCHDPFTSKASEKAAWGEAQNGFVFLGYDVRPGLRQPSPKARTSLLKAIDEEIAFGKESINRVLAATNTISERQRYAQTLSNVDRIIKGWGESFAYGNSIATLSGLDVAITERLQQFGSWYNTRVKHLDWQKRRRASGVGLLTDIEPKSLDHLPFVVSAGKKFRSSTNVVTIYTDGSLVKTGKRGPGTRGPGGWAFVVPETGQEMSGSVAHTTNNQMELTAVLEAIRAHPGKPLIIKTDSQYVCDIANSKKVAKHNTDLWMEFEAHKKEKAIKVVWVKAHVGDIANERADTLAKQAANKEAKRRT